MKKLIVAICALACCATLSAQKLGFIAGPSLSYGIINSSDKTASLSIMPSGGMHAGLLFEMDVTSRWGFDAAVMYEMRTMNWKMAYGDSIVPRTFKRQLGYLNVPFHFYVNFHVQKQMTLSLFAGPVFTCGLHGEDWAWENTEQKKPVTYAREKIFDSDDGRIVRCEFAAEIGLALKWNALQGRISYQHGVNNLTKNNYRYTLPMSAQSTNYFTQGTVKLSVAYLFDLRK